LSLCSLAARALAICGFASGRTSLVLYSGKKKDEVSHAKLTSLGRDVWGLSPPLHTGRWERTPFVGTMDSVLGTLIETLGFHLDPRR